MKKNALLALIGAMLALILVSGCFEPLNNPNATVSYEIKKNGDMKIVFLGQGVLGADANEWQGDCTSDMQEVIDKVIAFQQNQLSSGAGLSDEDQEKIGNEINVLTMVKSTVSCSFVKQEQNGTLQYSLTLTPEEANLLYSVDEAKEFNIAKRKDGIIRATIPIPDESSEKNFFGLNVKLDEIKLKFDGKLVDLTPDNFEKEDDYYVLKDANQFQGQKIELLFNPTGNTGAPIDNGNGTGSEPSTGISIFGISLNIGEKVFGIDLLQIVSIIIITIIAIVVLLLIKKRRGNRTEKFEKPKKSEKKIKKEEIISEEKTEKKESEEESGSFTRLSDEAQQIEKLVKVLKPKAKDYSEEQIRQAILNQGYSDSVAEEVIKRIFY